MDERRSSKGTDLQQRLKIPVGRVTLTADTDEYCLALSSEQVARIYNTGFPWR